MVPDFTLMICRIAIVLAFALSAGGKALDMPSFQFAIKDFRLLPAHWAKAVAYCLVSLEAIVVLLMLNERAVFLGFGLATGLLALFTTAVVMTIQRNMSITCNCFGRTERRVSTYDIGRNVILIGIAVAGAWLSLTSSSSLASGELVLSGLLAVSVVVLAINLSDVTRTLLRPFQAD